MKFVVDKYIPFIEGVLEPFGKVVYASPQEITPQEVRDADALLVRTRTHIGPELLSDSKCKFVATATIGMDHFDTPWCEKNKIKVVNAPGCNAPAVAQYVFSALEAMNAGNPENLTLAIVGVGHVGSIVERWGRALGYTIMLVDPPREKTEKTGRWFSLEDAAKDADIITFHTPLIKDGEFPTFHLGNNEFFDSLKRKPIIINASRGAVVDNNAWIKAINNNKVRASVVDVWEDEPFFNKALLEKADIATFHIAGYSMDGKIRATQMVLDALSDTLGLPKLKAVSREANPVPVTIKPGEALRSYDIMADDKKMRKTFNVLMSADEIKNTFENLRDSYDLRPEI